MCFSDENMILELPNLPTNTDEREQTENLKEIVEGDNSTVTTMNCVVYNETSGKHYTTY